MTKVVSRKRIGSVSELDRSLPKIFSHLSAEDHAVHGRKNAKISHSREISLTEYIGKPDIPFTPSLIGWAILNKFKPNISKIIKDENERRLKILLSKRWRIKP